MGPVCERPAILVIGSRGFVGSHIARSAAARGRLLDDAGIDITDHASVCRGFERQRPDIVVLAAAMADIDRCEREKERAEAVNVTGAVHVARACSGAGALMVFLSSGAVFDGSRESYTEEDAVTPVSHYGRTKAKAEMLVAEAAVSVIILRLSLVLGLGPRPGTNSLLDKLAASWRAGRGVAVAVDELRNPIDAPAVGDFIFELAPSARGIFHLGSADLLSRYELTLKLAQGMGYPASLVIPQQQPPPGRAPRGRKHFLLTGKIQKFCRTPVPTADRVVQRCLDATA